MHKFSHIISLFLLCTGLALGGCGKASAPPQGQTGAASDSLKILTIGTADSGGTMYPVGKAISGVVEDSDSTLKLNVSASTGSAGNVRSLEQGSIDLGLVSGDVAFAAVNGSGEFKDAPFKGLKVIAALYPSISNWMARDDSGIFYVHDLKGNKLGVGPHDSTTELAAKVSLSVLGVTEQNSTLVNCGLGSGAEEVKNRTLDAIHGFTGVPISGLAKLADAVPCHLLKYTDSELRSIIRSKMDSLIPILSNMLSISSVVTLSRNSGTRESRSNAPSGSLFPLSQASSASTERKISTLHPQSVSGYSRSQPQA